jgi:uncharacterized protein YqgC (DUF456 family)
MDIFLIIIAALLMIVGIIGCIIPALPGPPVSYVGLLLLHFTDRVQFSGKVLIIWALVAVAVTVLDFVIPAWGTKKFGGSKYGIWGSIIGLFAGLPFGPIGIIAGPFLGAVIGEMFSGKKGKESLRAGLGSFAGFMTGVFLKLVASGMMIYYFIVELIQW